MSSILIVNVKFLLIDSLKIYMTSSLSAFVSH